MSAVMKIDKTQTQIKISDIAEDALKKANGNIINASHHMEKMVLADQAIYRTLMDPLLASACYAAVSKVNRSNRAVIWTAPNYTAGGNGSRVRELSSGNLLMFPLPGGLPLGEATRTEVSAAAEFYIKQSSDMSHKARWLTRIGDGLAGKKKVSSVYTEELLFKLQAEAHNG